VRSKRLLTPHAAARKRHPPVAWITQRSKLTAESPFPAVAWITQRSTHRQLPFSGAVQDSAVGRTDPNAYVSRRPMRESIIDGRIRAVRP
jgi:hypothetical protein